MNFKQAIEKLKRKNKIKVVKTEKTLAEISKEIKLTNSAILFENISKFENFKVAANIFTRENVLAIYALSREELRKKLLDALDSRIEPKTTRKNPFKEVELDLRRLPIFKYYREDGGPYITSGIYIADSPVHGRNLSYHRTLIIGKKKATLRLTHRNLWKYYEDSGRDLKVAVCIGVDPAIAIASSTNVSIDRDELEIAGGFNGAPIELVKIDNFLVPKDSEIIVLGKLTNEEASEGPFVDMTRTIDFVRVQPVLKVEKILVSKEPIYHAIVGGREEHRFLMGFPREPVIFKEVSKVAKCKDVALTNGGINWLHCVVSIRKDLETNVKEVISAVFKAHPSVKHVFVVDTDIDLTNPEEIEWALATRFQGDKDLYLFKGMRGSSLDPSASGSEDRRTTCKIGFDCTIPLNIDKKIFKRV